MGKTPSNLLKHHLDFSDAEIVFDGLTLNFEDDRIDYGEQWIITIGLLSGEFVGIAHTEENKNDTRIISMRKATKHEKTIFIKAFGN